MAFLHLQHLKKLGYSSVKDLPQLTHEQISLIGGNVLVSFRRAEGACPTEIIKDIHGCFRLGALPLGNVVLVGLEKDSPLAPQLIWDIVHQLSVGSTVTLIDDSGSLLERDYYQTAFAKVGEQGDAVQFKKVSELPAELNKGLDKWTFGIPVGPEDATLLNAVVERILALDVPEKEILLCGKPGENFLFWDKVRIVGEDIQAPPVRICAKKNRLAKEAKYENLCILHDRVYLPLGFYDAIKHFGDLYPISTFQSLYFDDKLNLVPRRYSDYHQSTPHSQVTAAGTSGTDVSSKALISSSTLVDVESRKFLFANPLRYSNNNYVTGSLYIAKKAVWNFCPQNEALFWAEFEDVEHGQRCSEAGIPSRVNPYAITQSLIGRPMLSFAGSVPCESVNGISFDYRPLMERVPLPRKPLIRVSEQKAENSLRAFVEKYVPRSIDIPEISGSSRKNSNRLKAILKTLNGLTIPIRRNAIQTMLKDYERLVLLDQAAYRWHADMNRTLAEKGGNGRMALADILINQFSQRVSGPTFMKSLSDYLIPRSFIVKLGTFCSAILLSRQQSNAFYLHGGLKRRYKYLLDSTPFVGKGVWK